MDSLLLVVFFRYLNCSLCSALEMIFKNCNCRLLVVFRLLLEFFGCCGLRGHFIYNHCCVKRVMLLLMGWLLVMVVMVMVFHGLWMLMLSLCIGLFLMDCWWDLVGHDLGLASDLNCLLVMNILVDLLMEFVFGRSLFFEIETFLVIVCLVKVRLLLHWRVCSLFLGNFVSVLHLVEATQACSIKLAGICGFLFVRFVFPLGWRSFLDYWLLHISIFVDIVASQIARKIIASVLFSFNNFLTFFGHQSYVGPVTALKFGKNQLKRLK